MEGVEGAKGVKDVLEKITTHGGLPLPSASNILSEDDLKAIAFVIQPTGVFSCCSSPDHQKAFTAAQVRVIIQYRSLSEGTQPI